MVTPLKSSQTTDAPAVEVTDRRRSLVRDPAAPLRDESFTDESRGTNGWITRNQAAELMGVSPQILIVWERKGRIEGKLAFRQDRAGRFMEQVCYDPTKICMLPRRSLRSVAKDPDELAARVTECLELGWSDRDIVLELRVGYEKISRLRDLWMDGGGATRVITRELADGLAEIVGPFETVAELLERLRSGFFSAGVTEGDV